jgi:acyl CoA:acetate/3-ketoacid CoA transferase beta subunit
MTLIEIAEDTTVEEVKANTDCDFEVAADLGRF